MSARRGWCPSLHEPMQTGDGMLVRIKPRGGLMSARAVRVLAGAAVSFGNGVLELTRRGAVQARGLSPATAALFAGEMVAAGLGSPGAGEERRRTVAASPLIGADPAVHAATRALAASLERALEEAPGLDALPSKFGIAVDGGGVLPLGDAGADISVRLLADGAELLLAGGERVACLPIDRVVAAVIALARSCGGARMSALVAERGEAEMFWRCELVPVRASAGAPARSAVGVHAYEGGSAFGAGLAFGSAMASDWVCLAELATRHGDGALRLSPWRALLIAGVDDPDPLREEIAGLGFVTDPGDPRLRVEACPGHPSCTSGTVATRALASRLRPPPGTTVHVSGCDKGCAHPGPATITLVGREGRFDLVRNGRASDAPERSLLGEAELMAL